MLVVAAVRLRAGVLRLRDCGRCELDFELCLRRRHQVVHGCDRARHRRPAGRECRALQLGKRALAIGDVLVECRVRAPVELRGLLPEVLEGDVVPLVSGTNRRAGIESAGSGLGDVAGRRLQCDRQGTGRGEVDRRQRALWRLSGVGDDAEVTMRVKGAVAPGRGGLPFRMTPAMATTIRLWSTWRVPSRCQFGSPRSR